MSTAENPATAANVSKGLEGIIAAHTRLSDVRGDVGKLIYCGYDIDELAGKVSYEEVVYLLHHNHLPTPRNWPSSRPCWPATANCPRASSTFWSSCRPTALRCTPSAPASAPSAATTRWPTTTMDAQRRKALRLIAQIPVVTAYFHRARQGKPLVHPDASLGEAANFRNT